MSEQITTLPDAAPTLRVMPMPKDLNAFGDVSGGWVMAQVDIAGALPAMRRARGRIATVAVNSFQFRQPVSAGDVVSFYAEVVQIGRSSITVDVQVYAERHPDRVSEMVLASIATTTRGEVEWITRGVGAFFPEAFDRFTRAERDRAQDGQPGKCVHESLTSTRATTTKTAPPTIDRA